MKAGEKRAVVGTRRVRSESRSGPYAYRRLDYIYTLSCGHEVQRKEPAGIVAMCAECKAAVAVVAEPTEEAEA